MNAINYYKILNKLINKIYKMRINENEYYHSVKRLSAQSYNFNVCNLSNFYYNSPDNHTAL